MNSQDGFEQIATRHPFLSLFDFPDYFGQDVVPRIMIFPRFLLDARRLPQLVTQDDRCAFAFPLCRLGPELVAVALQRPNVDACRLHRPEAPVGLLEVLIVVRRGEEDAAARLILASATIGRPRSVMRS
jgi:hypothetical protein